MRVIVLLFFWVFPTIDLNFSGKVTSVIDGDTIEILNNEKEVTRIRLKGIDCPERSQAFGTKAKQFTASLCFGMTIAINGSEKDYYGRTLGDVVLPDGKILNHELVKAGLAWHYKKYSSDETLARLEKEAKEAKRGLWADPESIAPWEFRKTK